MQVYDKTGLLCVDNPGAGDCGPYTLLQGFGKHHSAFDCEQFRQTLKDTMIAYGNLPAWQKFWVYCEGTPDKPTKEIAVAGAPPPEA